MLAVITATLKSVKHSKHNTRAFPTSAREVRANNIRPAWAFPKAGGVAVHGAIPTQDEILTDPSPPALTHSVSYSAPFLVIPQIP